MSAHPKLPSACAAPCAECPWRRDSTPGHLGPLAADQWVQVAHGEEPIACHMTIRDVDASGKGSWDHPSIRQCKGAAIYRRNVAKSPHNPTDAAHTAEADRVTVFSWPEQFIAHHTQAADRTVTLNDQECRALGELFDGYIHASNLYRALGLYLSRDEVLALLTKLGADTDDFEESWETWGGE